MFRIIASVVVCLSLVSPAAAQIKASGTPMGKVQEFTSPMHLEVPLDSKDPVWTTRDLQIYICDTSSIETLRVWRQKKRAKDTTFEITIMAAIHTEPGEDRMVNLRMGMRNDEVKLVFRRKGGRYLAQIADESEPGWAEVFGINKIDAEEGKTTEGKVKIRIEQDAMRTLLDGPNPFLDITMTVVRNP